MSDICQSCALPFRTEKQHGTNDDGSLNSDYCVYCYKDGKFIDEDFTVDDMANHCAKFMDEVNEVMPKPLSRDEFIQNLQTTLPNLKRWKN